MLFHSNFFPQKFQRLYRKINAYFKPSNTQSYICWPLLCNNRTVFYSHLFASLHKAASTSQKRDAKRDQNPITNIVILKPGSTLPDDIQVHLSDEVKSKAMPRVEMQGRDHHSSPRDRMGDENTLFTYSVSSCILLHKHKNSKVKQAEHYFSIRLIQNTG